MCLLLVTCAGHSRVGHPGSIWPQRTVSHLVQLEISSPRTGKYPEAKSCLPGQTSVLNSTGQEASPGWFLFSYVYLLSLLLQPLPPPPCIPGLPCVWQAVSLGLLLHRGLAHLRSGGSCNPSLEVQFNCGFSSSVRLNIGSQLARPPGPLPLQISPRMQCLSPPCQQAQSGECSSMILSSNA